MWKSRGRWRVVLWRGEDRWFWLHSPVVFTSSRHCCRCVRVERERESIRDGLTHFTFELCDETLGYATTNSAEKTRNRGRKEVRRPFRDDSFSVTRFLLQSAMGSNSELFQSSDATQFCPQSMDIAHFRRLEVRQRWSSHSLVMFLSVQSRSSSSGKGKRRETESSGTTSKPSRRTARSRKAEISGNQSKEIEENVHRRFEMIRMN